MEQCNYIKIRMMHLVKQCFPIGNTSSTQAHIHNARGVKCLEEIGVKRVVLARELNLNEIKRNKNTTI
jgi:putative protease